MLFGVTTFEWTKKLRDLASAFDHGKTEMGLQLAEFKVKEVELSKQCGSSAQVTSELDVPPKNLSRRKQEYDAGKLDGTSKPALTKSGGELEKRP